MNKEIFEKIENEYGCGYWKVCDDHACPCHPNTPVSKGYDEEIYKSMQKSAYDEC